MELRNTIIESCNFLRSIGDTNIDKEGRFWLCLGDAAVNFRMKPILDVYTEGNFQLPIHYYNNDETVIRSHFNTISKFGTSL